MPYLDVFGFTPKTAWPASCWTGALVAASSLQPVCIQLQAGWKTVDTGPNKTKKNMAWWPPQLNSDASTGMRREDKLLWYLTATQCLWLVLCNDWSRWFATSNPPPICSPSFSFMAQVAKMWITKLGCEKHFCSNIVSIASLEML
jgi:hypothetical protein